MKPENIKYLTIAGVVGAIGIASLVYKQYSTNTNNTNNNNNNNNNINNNTSTVTPTETTLHSLPKDKHEKHKKKHNQPKNNNDMVDIEDLNKSCGFCRDEILPENRKELSNTIHNYERHFFLCTGIAYDQWLPKYFSATPFLETVQSTIKKYKLPFIFNGIDMPSTSNSADSIDILVFPEMIKLVGVTIESLDKILTFFEENPKPSIDQFPSDIKIEVISNKFVFVCAHKQKDDRCGFCGPVLMDDLRKEISNRSLEKEIQVYGSTHVGGHKYAGNAIVFPPGHWYGYVTPKDVNSIIDSTISCEIYKPLWRGSMGVDNEKKENNDF